MKKATHDIKRLGKRFDAQAAQAARVP